MEKQELLANIQSGTLSVRDISTEDFKALMLTPETKSYALLLCSRAYFAKATESLNQHMDDINLNDNLNRQIIADTYDLVQMDVQGQVYVNGAGCAMLFSKYFTESFMSMWDIETGNPNFLQMLANIFNLRKGIREIKLYNEISEQADLIKAKYINSNPDSNNNLPAVLERGWNELKKDMESEEFLEDLDYYDGVEEFFEMSVSTIGSLEALFSDLGQDLEPLKKLLEKRRKIYQGK